MTTRSAINGIAIFAAALACLPARAGFIGLQVVAHTTVNTAAGPKKVYRLYAWFSNGADRVFYWTGMGFNFTTLESGPCGPLSAFYQAPLGANQAPTQADIDKDPDTQWDTFATIGVSVAEQGIPIDQTVLSPTFPPFIDGNSVTIADGAFAMVLPDAPQSRADFAGDGDPQLRVLLMQLTLKPDEFPYGQVGELHWISSTGQLMQDTSIGWIGPSGHGRCCLPTGTCVVEYDSDCAQFHNGYFIHCQSCDACELTCVPDIVPHPGDGQVDVADLLAVIAAWGPHPSWNVVPADCSPQYGDNVVDIKDLLTVIAGWGPCHK